MEKEILTKGRTEPRGMQYWLMETLKEEARAEGLEEGLKEGLEQGKKKFVKYLIKKREFTDKQIAEIAEVSISFVRETSASMRQE